MRFRYDRLTRRAREVFILGAVLTSAACGAKTGLLAPDLDVQDVVDASPDVTMRPIVCIESMPDVREPVTVQLTTAAQVAVADVLFVIDRTSSMKGAINNVRDSLRSVIVPGLVRAIPDLRLGLVTHADFPTRDPRDPSAYGERGDTAFTLERSMSGEFTALQGAIGAIELGLGGDPPEAQVESLYQIATGEGLGRWIPRAGGCPSVGIGYACFRPRAEHVIVMITDAAFHNGPNNTYPYAAAAFAPGPVPHTYAQAIGALRERLSANVIGIDVASIGPGSGGEDLRRLASDTGAVGADGRPLVFPTNAGRLGEQVVSAVTRFTQEVLLNVSARAVDVDGSGGAALVTAVIPQRAEPMRNVRAIADNTFKGVVPGTQLVFGLQLDTSRIMPRDTEQRFTVRVEFLSDGRPTLGYRDVEIVVPARSMRCEGDAGAG